MAIRRGNEMGGQVGAGAGARGGERLPWLEPVEDEDDAPERGGGYGGVILAAIAVLLAFALVTAGVIWWRRGGAVGDGQIIRAEPGPYKERPKDAGGLKPAPEGEVAYGTGAGQDIDSPIDLGALPEQPVTGPGSQPRGAPEATPAPSQSEAPAQSQPARSQPSQLQPPQSQPPRPRSAPAPATAAPMPRASTAAATPPALARRPEETARAPVPAEAAAPAGGEGGTVQLGAFSSQAKAQAAWKSLSRRFGFLAGMTPTVSAVQSGETTLYRLRAGGGGAAAALCAKLRVAGETCAVVG